MLTEHGAMLTEHGAMLTEHGAMLRDHRRAAHGAPDGAAANYGRG